MNRAIFTLLFFAPSAVFALGPSLSDQFSSAAITAPDAYSTDGETANIGADECERYLDGDIVIEGVFSPSSFDPTSDDNVQGVYYFDVPRNSTGQIACSDGLCEQVDETAITNMSDSIVVSVDFADLVGTEGESCEGFDNEYFIRIDARDSDDEDSAIEATDVKLVVDTVRPSAPTGLEASATESGITVSFTGIEDSDLDRYYVFYSTDAIAAGDVDPDSATTTPVSANADTDGRIDVELETGATYFIGVAARDDNGNFGPLSNVIQAEAVDTQDFWEVYRGAGGNEDGCATTKGNHLLPLLLFIGFFGLRRTRRKKQLVSALALAATVLSASSLSAETPKYGAFEFKIGGYYPSIDDEFGGNGPYQQVFGSDSTIMGEFELDGYFWQGFVNVGVGVHFGYAAHSGDAVSASGEETSDTTRITYFPLRVSGIARLDYFAEEFGIPFVPNAKLGLDLYRWRIADGNGDTSEFDGSAGSGWKTGWHASFGLQFLLDFLAPGMASGMDLHFGVNNSYLFAEYLTTHIDGFGGDGFDLSDNQWMFGLAFEF